ncbi:MAG: hypothetical protein GW947_02810 [Candidatus Pacebacteria bacterium]|nr:hypothetical protein [Candidatus Paceibacterota bacterium]PIR61039.1 MAG: hypothetical protein COU68_01580 [Candidatus Pacebacteria bacterium CG10_big_fil_rev_8_21_14_0_10_45_6]
MNRRDDGDQSRFALEEPLFESNKPMVEEVPVLELTEAQLSAKKKKKVLKLAGLVFGVAILLLIAISALAPKKNEIPNVGTEPEKAPLVEKTQLQLRIDDLRTDLRQADPNKQPLLFPPLNYKLGITTNE